MVIDKWSAICELVDYIIDQQQKSNYHYGSTMADDGVTIHQFTDSVSGKHIISGMHA